MEKKQTNKQKNPVLPQRWLIYLSRFIQKYFWSSPNLTKSFDRISCAVSVHQISMGIYRVPGTVPNPQKPSIAAAAALLPGLGLFWTQSLQLRSCPLGPTSRFPKIDFENKARPEACKKHFPVNHDPTSKNSWQVTEEDSVNPNPVH